ncbi:hypothetical protein CRYUN_Cryun01aG0205200 [Craigia yunnanensis]
MQGRSKCYGADFFFSGLANPGVINNSVGSVATGANVEKIPGLNTLGVSLARIDYEPGGLNPPHTHPRATEIIFVLDGELDVGFITTANKLISKSIKKGDIFVFPKGLVHFQKNNGGKPASVIAGFNSQFPGTQSIATTLFTSTPAVPDNVLTKAFQIGTKEKKKKQKNFRKRSIQEDEGDDPAAKSDDDEDRKSYRLALEEVKFLQKQRERKSGIPAIPTVQTRGIVAEVTEKGEADGEKEELVLQYTFAQETTIMLSCKLRVKYVEQELAKKKRNKEHG